MQQLLSSTCLLMFETQMELTLVELLDYYFFNYRYLYLVYSLVPIYRFSKLLFFSTFVHFLLYSIF